MNAPTHKHAHYYTTLLYGDKKNHQQPFRCDPRLLTMECSIISLQCAGGGLDVCGGGEGDQAIIDIAYN